MSNFSLPLLDYELYKIHHKVSYIMFFLCVFFCILGYLLKNNIYKKNITIFLIGLSFFKKFLIIRIDFY